MGDEGMAGTDRRQWKLAVIRALSADGLHIATVRRTVGSRAFNALLDHAYDSAPDPVRGAQIVRALLEERHGDRLERPITPWSRE
jgi:hypothetical protein